MAKIERFLFLLIPFIVSNPIPPHATSCLFITKRPLTEPPLTSTSFHTKDCVHAKQKVLEPNNLLLYRNLTGTYVEIHTNESVLSFEKNLETTRNYGHFPGLDCGLEYNISVYSTTNVGRSQTPAVNIVPKYSKDVNCSATDNKVAVKSSADEHECDISIRYTSPLNSGDVASIKVERAKNNIDGIDFITAFILLGAFITFGFTIYFTRKCHNTFYEMHKDFSEVLLLKKEHLPQSVFDRTNSLCQEMVTPSTPLLLTQHNETCSSTSGEGIWSDYGSGPHYPREQHPTRSSNTPTAKTQDSRDSPYRCNCWLPPTVKVFNAEPVTRLKASGGRKTDSELKDAAVPETGGDGLAGRAIHSESAAGLTGCSSRCTHADRLQIPGCFKILISDAGGDGTKAVYDPNRDYCKIVKECILCNSSTNPLIPENQLLPILPGQVSCDSQPFYLTCHQVCYKDLDKQSKNNQLKSGHHDYLSYHLTSSYENVKWSDSVEELTGNQSIWNTANKFVSGKEQLFSNDRLFSIDQLFPVHQPTLTENRAQQSHYDLILSDHDQNVSEDHNIQSAHIPTSRINVSQTLWLVHERLVQEPLVQEQLVKERLVQEPPVKEPLVQEPLVQEPLVKEPLVQEPLEQEPLVKEPLVQEPLVQEPLVQEPLVQEPLVQEPLVQEPLVQELLVQEPLLQEPFSQLFSRVNHRLTVADHHMQ